VQASASVGNQLSDDDVDVKMMCIYVCLGVLSFHSRLSYCCGMDILQKCDKGQCICNVFHDARM
jgi:hypothetical protein